MINVVSKVALVFIHENLTTDRIMRLVLLGGLFPNLVQPHHTNKSTDNSRTPYYLHRYSAPFREAVQGWIIKLSTVSEIIEQWLMVQNMWMYMEAVFSGALAPESCCKCQLYRVNA